MSLKIEKWTLGQGSAAVDRFLERPAFDPEAEKSAARMLADIRRRGNAAVLDAAEKFDGAVLKVADMQLDQSEIEAAVCTVPARIRKAVKDAHARVRTFAKAGMRADWQMKTAAGGVLGERFSPMERVGLYIPGGAAPLASTAVMTATLAKSAGVREIVACTPCGHDKKINPVLLYALKIAGATEIYRIGGIQSIGMMAFGTSTVAPVQKIAGPGNAYVTAAKRQVYGFVGIDQVAGPSEIAILADDSARAAWIAADLLSQAEHGSGHEKSLLVTDSMELAEAVQTELKRQINALSRAEIVRRIVRRNGILIVAVPDLKQGIELVNRFAPEHFEIMTRSAARMLPLVRCAGAVFVGEWTPESVGDFVAGPSHVLPTGGAARMFNGLTADDFRRRHSFVQYTRDDLAASCESIGIFAEVEGLDAHGYSAAIRFEQ
jgi:histidinol dehydrogenase